MKKFTPFVLAGILLVGVGCQHNPSEVESPVESAAPVTSETSEAQTTEKESQLVAEVGDRTVERDYFDKNLALQTYGYQELKDEEGNFDAQTQAQYDQIRELLLEDLVDLNIVMILAEEAGISVTEEEVEDAVKRYMDANIEPDAESPTESSLAIRDYFKEENIDEDFIRVIMKEQLTFQKYLAHLETEYFADAAAITAMEDDYLVEVEASHILVDTKEKADEIRAEVTPENFAELAKEHSNDPGSKDQGGSLGYFKKNMMVKEFADQAYETPVGEISGPVKSDFGYHIIHVTGQKTMADIRSTEEDQTVIDQEEHSMRADLLTREYYRIIDEAKGSIQVNTYPL